MKGAIQKILFLWMMHWSAGLLAQNDTLLLTGDIRHYGDSVVLRWNSFSAADYLHIYRHEAIIERRSSDDEPFEIVGRQKAIAAENWGVQQSSQHQPDIIAAASLYQLLKESVKPEGEIPELTERNETMNFLWANLSLYADLYPGIANKANLRFCDQKPPNNNRIEYRLYFASDEFVSDTFIYIVEGKGHQPIYPGDFTAQENEANIAFTIPANRKFTAYFLQRSPMGKPDFKNLNNAPLVIPANQGEQPMIYWTDSVSNYVPHIYRIYAVDMFGNPSAYSNTLTAMARDLTPPPIITAFKIAENTNKTLTLTWNKPSNKHGENGIAIYQKQQSEEDFIPVISNLLPVNSTQYIHQVNPDQSDYYFQLRLYDTAGNYSITENFYQLVDSIPPSQPLGLKASVDSNGVVTLTWKPNKEKDLKGYLIFFGNSAKAEMSGLVNRPLYDTIYRDTLSLKLLNKEVFYQIQASDRRFNLSPLSEKIMALRPDKLAPVAPVIQKYFVTDSSISLHWIPSSSQDVAFHTLRKKNIRTGEIKSIVVKADTLYLDKDIVSQESYEYIFNAIDSAKNISPSSNAVTLKTYRNIYLPAVTMFSVLYDSAAQAVRIGWEYPATEISKIVLYKGITASTVTSTPLKIASNQKFVLDTNIKQGQVYYYAIKIYLKNGTQTLLNTPIGVFVGKP